MDPPATSRTPYPTVGIPLPSTPLQPPQQTSSATSSAAVDFTRRRNWTSIVLNTLPTWLFALGPSGRLLYGSPASRELLGLAPSEITGRALTDYMHVDDVDTFVREFKRCMCAADTAPLPAPTTLGANGHVVQMQSTHARETRVFLRFRGKDDRYVVLEVTGRGFAPDAQDLAPENGPALAFFGAARNYPVRVTAMFDQFLELRAENEALKRRIAELNSTARSTSDRSATSGASVSGSPLHPDVPAANAPYAFASHPEDARKRARSTVAATAATTTDPTSGMLPDSLYVAGQAFDPAVVFSTFDQPATAAPALISPIDPALSRQDSVMASPKIAAAAASTVATSTKASLPSASSSVRVCTDCGATESPEWRRGPNGPKTLCNACGLRWAKRQRRESELAAARGSKAVTESRSMPG